MFHGGNHRKKGNRTFWDRRKSRSASQRHLTSQIAVGLGYYFYKGVYLILGIAIVSYC